MLAMIVKTAAVRPSRFISFADTPFYTLIANPYPKKGGAFSFRRRADENCGSNVKFSQPIKLEVSGGPMVEVF
jgi:hypothetical protein